MKQRSGIYAAVQYIAKNYGKVVELIKPEQSQKVKLLLHSGYKLDESDLTFFKTIDADDFGSEHEIPLSQLVSYDYTQLHFDIYKVKAWDSEYVSFLKEHSTLVTLILGKSYLTRQLRKRFTNMNSESRLYFTAYYLDNHETTPLEISNAFLKIPDVVTKEFNQNGLFRIYIELKDLALRFPRLCFHPEQLNQLTMQSLKDYSRKAQFPVIQKYLLDSIFTSESFWDAASGLLGDSMEYPHNTSRLTAKELVDKIVIECEHRFAIFADSIAVVNSTGKTYIKIIQTGSNMPRSDTNYTKTMYFDATGRTDTETIISLAKEKVRIDK